MQNCGIGFADDFNTTVTAKLQFVALFQLAIDVTFLCPHKKVTKESGIGEALRHVLPHGHTPSPMYPSRGALGKIFKDSTLYLSDFDTSFRRCGGGYLRGRICP